MIFVFCLREKQRNKQKTIGKNLEVQPRTNIQKRPNFESINELGKVLS